MVTQIPKVNHPPSPRWSNNSTRMIIHLTQESHQPSQVWSPTILRMVTPHPKDSHPPSKGWSPTMRGWSLTITIQKTVTNLSKDGLVTHCHPPSEAWWPTIPRMVTKQPLDGKLPSLGCLIPIPRDVTLDPTILQMLTHHPYDDHIVSLWWWPTIPRIATRQSTDGHPSSTGPSPLKVIKSNKVYVTTLTKK